MKNKFKLYNIKSHLLTCFLILASSSKANSGQQSLDGILSLELIPKITIKGEFGKTVRVESSVSLNGPWTTWTNVLIGVESTVLVDLMAGSEMKYYRTVSGTSLGPDGFVWLPPGTFKTENYDNFGSIITATVKLTKGFWISDHEVTQAEYQKTTGQNPSTVQGDNLPVTDVSWNSAVMYCQQLTKWEQSAGRISLNQSYRLPTEAQWEYAARNAGVDDWVSFSNDIEKMKNSGWIAGINSENKIHPVRQKQPNNIGIYDMIGNVSEWCDDWWGPPFSGLLIDPTGPENSITWLQRNGTLYRGSSAIRDSRNNDRFPADKRYGTATLGFRPVLIER